jgi:hypothetical protein
MGLQQIEKLLHIKGKNYQNERQTIEWEKNFASSTSDKGCRKNKSPYSLLVGM